MAIAPAAHAIFGLATACARLGDEEASRRYMREFAALKEKAGAAAATGRMMGFVSRPWYSSWTRVNVRPATLNGTMAATWRELA